MVTPNALPNGKPFKRRANRRARLRPRKPPALHVIFTGRDAPPELIEFADLVTEMREIKHPFQKGVLAQAGVEF